MIKMLNIETDYKEVFALSQFAFQYHLSDEELHKKKAEAWRHIIWGNMDGDHIASKLHLIPLSIYLGDKKINMGGISSVATWPEYRRGGMVKELLSHALHHMKNNGQIISFLQPFSVSFYRKYGWEITFNEKLYTIPVDKLRKKWDASGYVRTKPFDYQTINSIYEEYAKTYNGALVRDERWWNQRVIKDKSYIGVAYNLEKRPVGYIQYEVKENVFHVHDFAYTSNNGWNILLEFIANHDSMAKEVKMTVPENDLLPLLVDEPRFEQKIEPYFMARITDVHQFLKEYPFLNSTNGITLHVKDDFFPDNTKTYQLTTTNITVLPYQDHSKGIYCTIQQLTAMMLNFVRPVDLYRIGQLKGSLDEIQKLDATISDQKPYFPDFF
ncbi:GNAT family N-acetyltransferase [Ornithinibacillus halophilus]|uniref:Predicted acetyltransferase n=1 Tax=Ornithinibacillus halophilus TaxID=930117 RepID=A0A1M5H5P5_9BACI|nr:GNAT family N-acetyltransferase [Ornithinibacillus halophilus]SHG11213.1 Predicted acetyltransferase [Ornithinibacillus halophilus]